MALIPGGLFALAVQRGVHRWWLLVPLAVATWALVHASGVHATVAGVLLGFVVPVLGRHSAAERFEHRLRPLSAGRGGAGVRVLRRRGDRWRLGRSRAKRCCIPSPIGVFAGLVLGKPLGVFITTFLLAKFTHAPSTTIWPGATCSVCRCLPASVSPCRC